MKKVTLSVAWQTIVDLTARGSSASTTLTMAVGLLSDLEKPEDGVQLLAHTLLRVGIERGYGHLAQLLSRRESRNLLLAQVIFACCAHEAPNFSRPMWERIYSFPTVAWRWLTPEKLLEVLNGTVAISPEELIKHLYTIRQIVGMDKGAELERALSDSLCQGWHGGLFQPTTYEWLAKLPREVQRLIAWRIHVDKYSIRFVVAAFLYQDTRQIFGKYPWLVPNDVRDLAEAFYSCPGEVPTLLRLAMSVPGFVESRWLDDLLGRITFDWKCYQLAYISNPTLPNDQGECLGVVAQTNDGRRIIFVYNSGSRGIGLGLGGRVLIPQDFLDVDRRRRNFVLKEVDGGDTPTAVILTSDGKGFWSPIPLTAISSPAEARGPVLFNPR